MLFKNCKKCGRVIPYPLSYCSDCQIIVDQQREEYRARYKQRGDAEYNKRRDPKYIRFYNSQGWRSLRVAYIQGKGYRCESCGGLAVEVHHKKPIQTEEGWNLRLDINNLEALCTKCHNERHNRFKRRKSRRF